MTGIGAAAGSQLFVGAGPEIFAVKQGLAAGAMLTGITQPQHNRRMVSMYTGTVRQISTSQAPSP